MPKTPITGAALIIVIFVMLVFGILGWSLAVMQSGMFESSLRIIAPDQALNLAEAGARWGINEFIINGVFSSASDIPCSSASDWVTHTLAPGQYQVCTRPPLTDETGSVVVESIGYVPSVTAYQAKRKVKIMASVGSFDKTMIVRNLFNWTGADRLSSFVNGSMLCQFYEGASAGYTGNGIYNEYGVDYSNDADDLLPRTERTRRRSTPPRRDVGEAVFPEIDMAFYENDRNATILEPNMTSTIDNVTQAGSNTQVTMSKTNFFGSYPAQWAGLALRNISRGHWKSNAWKDILSASGSVALLNGTVDWLAGERVTVVPRIRTIDFREIGHTDRYYYNVTVNGTLDWPVGQAVKDFSRGLWNYTDWGVINASTRANNQTRVQILMDSSVQADPGWAVGDWIGYVRRFTEADAPEWGNGLLRNHYVLYVESDALFDTRPGDIDTRRTGVVCEGDAVIKGPNRIRMEKRPLLYPNLATENGNIYSDAPSGNANQRIGKRIFDDIIFTENGDIDFNYVDCQAMYGANVTLSGIFRMQYDPDLTRLGGYAFGVSGMTWLEE